MIQCQQCGQGNSEQSQFCRFCGIRLGTADGASQNDYNYEAPRPYAWKTDEFQTQSEPRLKPGTASAPTFSPQPGAATLYQPLVYGGPQHLTQNYRCRNCGTTALPVIERRISTAGWVVFSLLLVFTLVFFWIGLLMKENVSICPVCRAKLA